jgi:FKBP-type peptidyl-prolyl cis-trans isomerase
MGGFDESSASGITFPLQNVKRDIPLFKEGGSGTLLMSHLGYGSNDSNGITGGSVLVFDVKLISVK